MALVNLRKPTDRADAQTVLKTDEKYGDYLEADSQAGAAQAASQFGAQAANARQTGAAAQTATQAQALGYNTQGNQVLNQTAALGSQQRAAGTAAQTAANTQAAGLQVNAGQAQQRGTALNMSAGAGAANQANDSRNRTYEALGGLAQQGAAGTDTSALRNFYQGPAGPSAAASQMQGASEQNMANSLALARSGRSGMNPAAERQAMFQNAATAAQTNQQLGTLRAQEESAARGQNLQAMTAEQQAQLQGRGLSIQAQTAAAQGAAQQRVADLQSQGLSLQQAQAQAQVELQSRGLNDQTSLAYQGLAQNERAQGQAAALGYGQLANQSAGQGQQYSLGMANAANTQTGQGYNAQAQGQQIGLGYQSAGEGVIQAQQQAALKQAEIDAGLHMNYENNQTANLGNWLGLLSDETQKKDVEPEPNMGEQVLDALGYMKPRSSTGGADYMSQVQPQQSGSGGGGLLAKAGLAAMFMSDKRAKVLEGKLDELGKAFVALGGERPAATAGVERGGEVPAQGPAYDMRPAQAYSYEYKDPNAPGARPGRRVGPMAQDLERSPATAPSVVTGPDGVKRVDTPSLTMVNTSAIGEQQRRIDQQEAELEQVRRQQYAALGGPDATRRAGVNRYASTGGL